MQAVLVRGPHVVLRDEDRVCFNKATGCVLQLNDAGYALVLHFESPSPALDAVRSLAALFRQTESSIEAEALQFIEYLVSLDFLSEEAA